MGKARIRLGLVGVGKIARDQHIPAIGGNQRFDLVATASKHDGVDGLPHHPDLRSLLDAGHELDAIVLCTPPAVRSELAHQALDAGLHVFLEKPPAAALSQVERLRHEAARAGLSLFTSWHSRESLAVDAAKAWLAQRQIGAVRIAWRENVREWHPGQDWLLAAGGFGVFDPAINALSILTAIMPGVLALEAADLHVPANRAMPMRAAMTLSHDGAPIVHCDLDILHEGHQQWDIEVESVDGLLTLGAGGHVLTIAGDALPLAPNREYPRLYERFATLIDSGRSEVDARPLTLVADAMMLGTVHPIAPFEF
ncbi:Gfo/Idh/MocA family protein [Novosphingobium sp. FKTRR1]|uniref:Gfo/Idh/MocA family protein n=1 Tax=Novosphingobium sp. FKTRR1 TaxID=2879118 RepID=UPI001CF09F17|nr:Gfo/Idh/MocA family oxidoreductase [Novosphingobium sp. FKTRR1]